VAGGTVDDDGDYSGHARTRDWFQSIQYATRILTVLAPPLGGRRSLLAGEAERRRSQVDGAARLRWIID
jgi:hypothetical protein